MFNKEKEMVMHNDDDKDPTGGGNGPFAGLGYGKAFAKKNYKAILIAIVVIAILSALL
jgi:hypothetical protein